MLTMLGFIYPSSPQFDRTRNEAGATSIGAGLMLATAGLDSARFEMVSSGNSVGSWPKLAKAGRASSSSRRSTSEF